MHRRRFDALLIDFYGTICAGDRLAVEAICRRIVRACALPVTPQELAIRWGCRFFGTVEESNHAVFQTLYACEAESLQATLTDFGVAIDPKTYVDELLRYWTDPPIYPDAARFLAGLNIPVCCVSNADTQPLMEAIAKHRLRFDAVVTSEIASCYKPRPEIFGRAVESLGVSPDRALHIGDSLHSDVGGASRAGIAAAWLCREDRIHDIGETQPEFAARSLPELQKIIGL